jgi:hypothetical protein
VSPYIRADSGLLDASSKLVELAGFHRRVSAKWFCQKSWHFLSILIEIIMHQRWGAIQELSGKVYSINKVQ